MTALRKDLGFFGHSAKVPWFTLDDYDIYHIFDRPNLKNTLDWKRLTIVNSALNIPTAPFMVWAGKGWRKSVN